MQTTYESILSLTEPFCRNHLNDEYCELAQHMAAALCRKRSSPVTSGQVRTWACAILYSLGKINFLSDPSTQPYMTMADLCIAFGVGQSTASAKAQIILQTLKTHQLDLKWSLSSLLDMNVFQFQHRLPPSRLVACRLVAWRSYSDAFTNFLNQ
ncbi:MAG: DUF6398 domain-containing protein [Pseudolabrys sp.]